MKEMKNKIISPGIIPVVFRKIGLEIRPADFCRLRSGTHRRIYTIASKTRIVTEHVLVNFLCNKFTYFQKEQPGLGCHIIVIYSSCDNSTWQMVQLHSSMTTLRGNCTTPRPFTELQSSRM